MLKQSIKTWELSKEMRLMLSLALRKEQVGSLEEINWELFESFVEWHRIRPLVADGIGKLPVHAIEQYPALKRIYESKALYARLSLKQIQHLASIASVFEQAGIHLISLKGPILAIELYGTPALRYSRDLDLLVSEADFEQACLLLVQQGYQEQLTAMNKTPLRRARQQKKQEELHRVFEKEDIVIELHWRSSYRRKESFDVLWENRKEKVLLGQKVFYLGQNDNAEYLISHAAGHAYNRLRWLLDLYELQAQKDFSWKDIWDYARGRGTSVLLLETLILLFAMPCFDMPDVECGQFCIVREENETILRYADCLQSEMECTQKLLSLVRILLFEDKKVKSWANSKYIALLPTTGRKRSRWDMISAMFEPRSSEYELIDLPDRLFFLYYLIRPIHTIWKHWKKTKR